MKKLLFCILLMIFCFSSIALSEENYQVQEARKSLNESKQSFYENLNDLNEIILRIIKQTDKYRANIDTFQVLYERKGFFEGQKELILQTKNIVLSEHQTILNRFNQVKKSIEATQKANEGLNQNIANLSKQNQIIAQYIADYQNGKVFVWVSDDGEFGILQDAPVTMQQVKAYQPLIMQQVKAYQPILLQQPSFKTVLSINLSPTDKFQIEVFRNVQADYDKSISYLKTIIKRGEDFLTDLTGKNGQIENNINEIEKQIEVYKKDIEQNITDYKQLIVKVKDAYEQTHGLEVFLEKLKDENRKLSEKEATLVEENRALKNQAKSIGMPIEAILSKY